MTIGVVVDNEFNHDARVRNECKILARAGHEVNVLCFNFGKHEPYEEIDKIKVYRISIKQKFRNILFAFNNSIELYNLFWSANIKKFIQKYNIQALHVHDLYMAKAAHYATKNTTIPFTLDLHENYPAAVKGYQWMYQFPFTYLIRPKKWERLEKKYLEYPQNIVVLSESFRDDLLFKYPFLKEKAFVVYPNVPDLDEFKNYPIDQTIYPKNDDFLLFYFGVISQRRGIFTVIEALKKIIKEIPSVKLLLIGPADKAEKEKFLKTITNPKLKKHITWYPWKDIRLLPSYIHSSDVCLSPIVKNDQHESGVANKVFQYMLFERPLIVSDCKPQAKIVAEAQCGLVFKSEDAEDLAQKINMLYQNQELSIEMGENGKKAVEMKYNTQNYGKNLVNLYD
ncbi:MAG: glycosyltransferase family 4 protein [Bacteroidales bacterium]|jgi:glycosyltransferase involved in cell wall biosynthesis|nr:glycosyltransferase family 4 protein [Bacteroidales bacterium]